MHKLEHVSATPTSRYIFRVLICIYFCRRDKKKWSRIETASFLFAEKHRTFANLMARDISRSRVGCLFSDNYFLFVLTHSVSNPTTKTHS